MNGTKEFDERMQILADFERLSRLPRKRKGASFGRVLNAAGTTVPVAATPPAPRPLTDADINVHPSERDAEARKFAEIEWHVDGETQHLGTLEEWKARQGK